MFKIINFDLSYLHENLRKRQRMHAILLHIRMCLHSCLCSVMLLLLLLFGSFARLLVCLSVRLGMYVLCMYVFISIVQLFVHNCMFACMFANIYLFVLFCLLV